MITEGPNSWDQLDTRGDLGAEHTADWEKNVAPLTQDRGTVSYAEFQADLSTVQLTDYADKILINHTIGKPGKIGGAGMGQTVALVLFHGYGGHRVST